jgi:hypothetical protein
VKTPLHGGRRRVRGLCRLGWYVAWRHGEVDTLPVLTRRRHIGNISACDLIHHYRRDEVWQRQNVQEEPRWRGSSKTQPVDACAGANANLDETANAYGRGRKRRIAGVQRSIKQIACEGQTR